MRNMVLSRSEQELTATAYRF